MKHLLLIFALLLPVPAAFAAENPSANYMVSSANRYATQAGLEILAQGGSAVDAAIAVQLVLTLVEPQSSGIGGGAFMLLWDGENVVSYDGRETAPAAVDETLFLKADGTPEEKRDMMPGGRAVGVPGLIAMLHMAWEKHGKLDWGAAFEPAIKLASEGFVVSPRLHFLIDRDYALRTMPGTRTYFFQDDGPALAVGTTLRNPAYADTLKLIQNLGPKVFYEGEIARDIVAAVQNASRNPGKLSLADMKAYTPKQRIPLCAPYKSYTICGMAPPSSGGIAVLQTLKILEPFNIAQYQPGDPKALHLMTEAMRLAYADRATWLGDSDFVPVPVDGLIADSYLKSRSALIDPDTRTETLGPGTPEGAAVAYRQAEPGEVPATSHFSIVDADGRTLAMTTTIENAFGSRLMVRGFLLNNQLTDFSFAPNENGKPVANRVEPGKRPLSSMSPTLVLDAEGRPVLTVGSPGGPLIIAFTAKTLLGVLEWGLEPQDAIELPNYIGFGQTWMYERDSGLEQQIKAMTSIGWPATRAASLASGLHAIQIRYGDEKPLLGGADPRREGVAAGD